MRLHASQGMKGRVIDLDTGKDIPKVIWLDEELGECEAYKISPQGMFCHTLMEDGTTGAATVHLKGRFKFIPKPIALNSTVRLGAKECVKCKSKLTLMDNDMCPRCYAQNRGKPIKNAKEMHPLEIKQKCAKCSRDATHSVSDEIQVTPEVGESFVFDNGVKRSQGKRLFDRAMTVGRRYFCRWCLDGPRLVDKNGEVMKTLAEVPAEEMTKEQQ